MMGRGNDGGDGDTIVGLNAALQKHFILPATSKKTHRNIENHNGKDKAASIDIGPIGNQERQQASTDNMCKMDRFANGSSDTSNNKEILGGRRLSAASTCRWPRQRTYFLGKTFHPRTTHRTLALYAAAGYSNHYSHP